VFKNYDHGDDTDIHALKNNFVSVVPVLIDFTAHPAIPELKKWNILLS
jgi:5'-nucleotidase